MLIADIETNLGDITIANTHLGLDEDERVKQARSIDNMQLGQDIDCGDYNQRIGWIPRAGRRSVEIHTLLSPDRTESTSVSGIPTHASGRVIDRASTDCGSLILDSVYVWPIDSDHGAPVGSFDLTSCFTSTP